MSKIINGKMFPTDQIKCLDHGFVRLVDFMGDDSSIVQAARISYGQGTKSPAEDRGLIRYLMRQAHTSPFEQVEIKTHWKLPIFVARQAVRHRAVSLNEISGRYTELKDEFYVPEPDKITLQNPTNKQGGCDETVENPEALALAFDANSAGQFGLYNTLLKSGMRKELARINLPLSTYTEWYWKIDLHNLLHFLKLRLDSHAQYEIRVYAEAIAEFVKVICPVTWEAFEDYRLHSMTLSRLEIGAIKAMAWSLSPKEKIAEEHIPNKREREEFLAKLERLFEGPNAKTYTS